MPGEKPKSQHFVHRAYLEGFQDPTLIQRGKRALWVYMPGKTPIPQAPERVAKRNYYYCHQQENERQFNAEHLLQKMEDVALPLLLRIRDRDFAFNQEDRLTFAGYVALAHTRVPTFEKVVNRIATLKEAYKLEHVAHDRKALEAVVARIQAETGEELDVDDYFKKLTGGSAYVEQTDRGWSLKQMFTSMLALQKVIFGMHWCFLTAPDGDDGFLTSDNPVSLFDIAEGSSHGIGFASSPAPHFTFPISREICLLAQPHPNPRLVKLTPSEVRRVNSGTITRADGQLYAPFNIGAVKKLFDAVSSQTQRPHRVLLKHGHVVEE
jgi:hypothetical protein